MNSDVAVLDIEGISKRFGALTASDAISLQVKPQEIHALIGPNGAGKSTLIKQICGEIKPDAGQVSLNGQAIDDLSAVERVHAGLARTFQVSSIIPTLSVLDNVKLAVVGQKRQAMRFWKSVKHDNVLIEQAQHALQRVELTDRAHVLTANLSHGERRQLEIAMALALQPQVFLMDEPMAGLDSGGSKRLTQFLAELRHEAPILLVEHDMEAVFALADRISVLVYGRIIFTGSVDEVRQHPEVKQAYLGESAV